MDLARPSKLEPVREEGWHIIPCDWWRTSFELVSWSYAAKGPMRNIAKPLYYCGSLFRARGVIQTSSAAFSGKQQLNAESDVTLNPELCGVRCAASVVAPYEIDVGFHSEDSNDSIPPERSRRADISVQVQDDQISLTRERWNKYVEDLTSGVQSEKSGTRNVFAGGNDTRASSPTSSRGGLHRSTSTLSSVDLTDSDLSFNSISIPSTPKGKSIEAIVDIKVASPVKGSNERFSGMSSPGRPLNASASSFIPSSFTLNSKAEGFSFATPTAAMHLEAQTPLVNFTFPSLDVPPLPSVKIKKDDQGFYSEEEVAAPVPHSQRASCAFLPPFLQDFSPRRRAPASKTRAMVERLRSSHNQSHSPIPNPPLYDVGVLDERLAVSEDDRGGNSGFSSPSSLDEDEDGWINLAEVDASSQESKARRTRNLFLALTRRRSGTPPPNQLAESSKEENGEIEIPMTSSPSPSSSPSPLSFSNDGWIEGSSTPPKVEVTPRRRPESRTRSHRKRRSSHVPSAPPPTAITPHFASPTTPRFPAVPHPPPFPSVPPHFPSQSPTPYVYTAYPSMVTSAAYTSYMQQLQLMQMQMRGGRRATAPNSAEWFQYPNPGAAPVPFAGAGIPPAPVSAAASTTPLTRRGSLW
ncbi:hypothetical protein Hypma_007423 [Hypsizygus marmoreus]|uniref:Uncharacterized protein n=1 Tax=Hypsizygus marmoreus TaxID=39966 RepID=A0A369JZN8_HYPMA|nr:hypothetical protein Hypma_007423 [Hypsizygus marmoreus]